MVPHDQDGVIGHSATLTLSGDNQLLVACLMWRSSRGMQIHWLSSRRLSLLDKCGGKILVSTVVTRIGLQSCPVHNGTDDGKPIMAAAIGNQPNFAKAARLSGISFLAPPKPCKITGRHFPPLSRCAWNMPSPGRTNRDASPGRASNEGRHPCSKQALAQVNKGTDRLSYGGRRFFGCPCLSHSPLGGRKIVRDVHSPTNDQATAQSREVSILCPLKGARANPVWIQAWHSAGVMSLSSRPFETIVETTSQ